MEVFTPDGQATGNLFFIGSNAAAETGPSYLSAADCGITTPTTQRRSASRTCTLCSTSMDACVPGTTPTPTPNRYPNGHVTPTATPGTPTTHR